MSVVELTAIGLVIFFLYGILIAAIVVFVRAFVRISHAHTSISKSLEKIALSMESQAEYDEESGNIEAGGIVKVKPYQH